jgi:hypothetical protein
MNDGNSFAEILKRLTRIEEAVAGIGHNGGPPLDDDSPSPEDPLLKPGDAATYLKTSEVTLERKRRKRTGPDYIKTGGRIFYRQSALDRYLAACTRPGSRVRAAAKGG